MAEATANSRGADQVRGMPKKPPLGEREARLIAESIPHIVWMAAADGSSTYFNQRGTAYTGCPDGEALGLSWLNFIHAGDAEPAGRDWEHAFETNTEFAFECRIRRHDGVYRWHSVRSLPVHGEDGNTLFWIGTATDIDHQKRLESSLRTSRQQAIETLTLLESIGRAEPVGVGYVDRNLRVVRLNRQLERFSSLPLEEQIGRTLAELRPELWPQIADIYDRALHGETVVNVEISAADPDHGGETSYYLYSCYPVGIDGRIIGVGNVVTDVTRLKKAEDSLARNLDAMVHAIGRTVEYRDPYTAGHQERVAALAAAMAVELDLSPSSVEGVKTAASIHDIGKIAIPAEILSKPGKLLPS